MQKTINYIIILIAVVVSFGIVCAELNDIGLVLKDASIVITITLPFIIQKLFKIKLNDNLISAYIIFIFVAQFLGSTLELYNQIFFFDKIVHTISGVLTAFIATIILKEFKIKNKKFIPIFMIIFSVCIAGLWEIFEYTANLLFGGDAQRVVLTGVNDTMQDIIVALIGSILMVISYKLKHKN